jgi:hypothetical protein
MLYKIRRYSRDLIEENPDVMFVFGDNFERVGTGGQASACRGLPNVIGIPTKRDPGTFRKSYLYDKDFSEWKTKSNNDLERLRIHLKNGVDIVIPEDGIGTGLAMLHKNAPLTLQYIEKYFDKLIEFQLSRRNHLFIQKIEEFNAIKAHCLSKKLNGNQFVKFIYTIENCNEYGDYKPFRNVKEEHIRLFWFDLVYKENKNISLWREALTYF